MQEFAELDALMQRFNVQHCVIDALPETRLARELRAPQRTLEQDAHGNWVPRWLEHGKPDHFAHAEAYCYAAGVIVAGRPRWPLLPVPD